MAQAIAIIEKNNMDTTSRKDGVVVEKYITGLDNSEGLDNLNALVTMHWSDSNKYKVHTITEAEWNTIKKGWILDRKDNTIKPREDILADTY
jgi:hypothetical protein